MPRKEKEVNMILSGKACKMTCKILSIFAKIGEVLFIIAAICIAIAGVFLGTNQSIIDLNQIVSEAEKDLNLQQSIVTISGPAAEKFLAKSHNEQMSFILVGMAVMVAAFAFMSVLARYIYRLFKNLDHGRTPFTMENVDFLQKIATWLFISLVTLDLSSLVLSMMLGGESFGVNISLSYYAIGFAILVLAVVFRHGYELEKKNK